MQHSETSPKSLCKSRRKCGKTRKTKAKNYNDKHPTQNGASNKDYCDDECSEKKTTLNSSDVVRVALNCFRWEADVKEND